MRSGALRKPAYSKLMNEEFDEREFCAVCGKVASDGQCFCHFYEIHRRVTLCSPDCAGSYLHPPEEMTYDSAWTEGAEAGF
jgi:hypothetical protein